MITIAITDDHEMIIEGLKAIFLSEKNYKIIAQYSNTKQTLENILTDLPDILLLDINLPDGNGIIICKEIMKVCPKIKIIAISNYEDISFVKQMIKNGAKGYLLKNTSLTEIKKAIECAINDEVYLPEKIKNTILFESIQKQKSATFIPKLTRREKEVLELIIQEHTTEEIAEKLCVTIKAIEAHRSNLIQKLGVRNTAGLVKIALEKGLL